nr:CvpA family protein [Wielerella bovis]
MTTFDLITLGILLCCIIVSVMRGLVGEVLAFASFIIGLLIAKMFAADVADIIFTSMRPREIAVIFAFVITYIVARVCVAILHEMLDLFIKKTRLSHINRILGGILGAIKGVIIISIGTLACSFSELPSHPEWVNAKTSPFFEKTAMLGTPYLPSFLADQIQFNHEKDSLKQPSFDDKTNRKLNSSHKKSSSTTPTE